MDLKNNDSLIIKPADKGGGIVLQEKDLYKSEILKQLSNTGHYCRLPSNPTKELQKRILQITNDVKPKISLVRTNFSSSIPNHLALLSYTHSPKFTKILQIH